MTTITNDNVILPVRIRLPDVSLPFRVFDPPSCLAECAPPRPCSFPDRLCSFSVMPYSLSLGQESRRTRASEPCCWWEGVFESREPGVDLPPADDGPATVRRGGGAGSVFFLRKERKRCFDKSSGISASR